MCPGKQPVRAAVSRLAVVVLRDQPRDGLDELVAERFAGGRRRNLPEGPGGGAAHEGLGVGNRPSQNRFGPGVLLVAQDNRRVAKDPPPLGPPQRRMPEPGAKGRFVERE